MVQYERHYWKNPVADFGNVLDMFDLLKWAIEVFSASINSLKMVLTSILK